MHAGQDGRHRQIGQFLGHDGGISRSAGLFSFQLLLLVPCLYQIGKAANCVDFLRLSLIGWPEPVLFSSSSHVLFVL